MKGPVIYENCLYFFLMFLFVLETKTRFSCWGSSFCGLANGPLTMTFSVFLVVIDTHRACCSEFAFTVMPRNLYRFDYRISAHKSVRERTEPVRLYPGIVAHVPIHEVF